VRVVEAGLDPKTRLEMTEKEARVVLRLADFLGSDFLALAASHALYEVCRGYFLSGNADGILELLDHGAAICPLEFPEHDMDYLTNKRRNPLSAWNPDDLRRVVPALRRAPFLFSETKTIPGFFDRTSADLFSVFLVDAKVTMPVLEAYCELFAGDFPGIPRVFEEPFNRFGYFLEDTGRELVDDGGYENARYKKLRVYGALGSTTKPN